MQVGYFFLMNDAFTIETANCALLIYTVLVAIEVGDIRWSLPKADEIFIFLKQKHWKKW